MKKRKNNKQQLQYTLTLLFCEGHLEPSFITRILRTDGWKNVNNILMEKLPSVLHRFMAGRLNKFNAVGGSGNWSNKMGYTPWFILRKATNITQDFIVILNTGGKKNFVLMNEIVQLFKNIQGVNGFDEIESIPTNIALFYDSSKPISERKEIIQKNFQNVLLQSLEGFSFAQDYEIIDNTDSFNKVGLFIFAKEQNCTITEYMEPLLRVGNEKSFEAVDNFVQQIPPEETNEKWSKEPWNKAEAIISIAGQIKKTGNSTTEMIAEWSFLDNNAILNDKNTGQLIAFFQKIID